MHLCISSKFHDRHRMACNLVQMLISTVYVEYNEFCEKNNKVPLACLAIKKEESSSNQNLKFN